MENEKKCVCLKILLDVNKERIWKALTDPNLTEKYMYNCQLHSSWEVNSDALWKQKNEDGTILKLNQRLLSFILLKKNKCYFTKFE